MRLKLAGNLDDIHENDNISVQWERDQADDPQQFVLCKRYIARNRTSRRKIPVDAFNLLNGTATVDFGQRGLGFVFAVRTLNDDLDSAIARSQEIDIKDRNNGQAPILTDAAAALTRVDPFTTLTSVSTPSIEANTAAESAASSSSTSRTPVIVGSVIGSLVLVTVAGILLYIFVIRRKRNPPSALYRGMMSPSSGASVHSNSNFRGPSPISEKSYHGYLSSPSTSFGPGFSNPFTDPYPNAISPVSTRDPRKSRAHRQHRSHKHRSQLPEYGYGFQYPEEKKLPIPEPSFLPLTDRQMEVQERIHNWQSELISAEGARITEIRAQIEKLRDAKEGDWAMNKSDTPPSVLLASSSR